MCTVLVVLEEFLAFKQLVKSQILTLECFLKSWSDGEVLCASDHLKFIWS